MNPILTITSFLTRILPAPIKRGIYRLGPLTRAIRRTLNRAAPEGLQEITVGAGALAGMRLQLNLQTEKDYWLGTYETDLQAILPSLAKPGMTAYDIGANIGYISLMLARATGENGRVLAFEALPANVNRWRTNIALNQLEDRVTMTPAAITDQTGTVQFLVHASHGMGKTSGSAGRESETYRDPITVDGLALDSFIFDQNNPHPDIIKIDIEGGEVLALPAMRRTLTELRPIILIELHGEAAAKVAWKTLTECGYTLHAMNAHLPKVKDLRALDWKAYVVGLPQ